MISIFSLLSGYLFVTSRTIKNTRLSRSNAKKAWRSVEWRYGYGRLSYMHEPSLHPKQPRNCRYFSTVPVCQYPKKSRHLTFFTTTAAYSTATSTLRDLLHKRPHIVHILSCIATRRVTTAFAFPLLAREHSRTGPGR